MDRAIFDKLAAEAGFDVAPDGGIYTERTDCECREALTKFADLLRDEYEDLFRSVYMSDI